jgi:hypothetical protein
MQVPESLVATLLLVTGSFTVGWAGVLGATMRSGETAEFLDTWVARLLGIGWWSYLGFVVMLSLELALAP